MKERIRGLRFETRRQREPEYTMKDLIISFRGSVLLSFVVQFSLVGSRRRLIYDLTPSQLTPGLQ